AKTGDLDPPIGTTYDPNTAAEDDALLSAPAREARKAARIKLARLVRKEPSGEAVGTPAPAHAPPPQAAPPSEPSPETLPQAAIPAAENELAAPSEPTAPSERKGMAPSAATPAPTPSGASPSAEPSTPTAPRMDRENPY